MTDKLLDIEGLTTVFSLRRGDVTAVNDISLQVGKGEIVGLVGESGSGKSVTGLSIMGLVKSPGYVQSGKIAFDGTDLTKASEEEMRKIRGRRISLIFQDSMSALNPVLNIETHIVESIRAHRKVSRAEARSEGIDALARLGIPDPARRLRAYPHQFSGGMRQRVTIALSILNNPDFIIADEPTTALDVTVQEQILHEMKILCRENGMGMLWITHDLAVVRELASRVYVMYGGKIVEHGTTGEVIKSPCHPYTRGLINSLPEMSTPGSPLKHIQGITALTPGHTDGCVFAPRCPEVMPACHADQPCLEKVSDSHSKACFLAHQKRC